MATPIIMPKFEMTQEDGTVVAWLKQEGDTVEKGEPILEVETDKVTMEVEAPASGILRDIRAEEGQVVPIGEPIAFLVGQGEQWPPAGSKDAAGDTAQAPAPANGSESEAEAQTGDGQPRATPVARRMARQHGVDLQTLAARSGERIGKEDVRAYLSTRESNASDSDKIRAVPAARRLAREEGVDLALVSGSGPGGRIQSRDVQRFLTTSARESTEQAGAAPAVEGQPALTASDSRAIAGTTRLNSIRQTTARRMTASFRDVPQFALSVDVVMDRALQIVEELNQGADETAPRITLTAFLVYACAHALRQHPEVNASYEDDQIIHWQNVNVGVAVAIDAGLTVPVIHNADGLGMRAISDRLRDLVQRARARKLQAADLEGGTFTISNLGMFSVDRFTAIVNPPQAAILAVGRVRKEAVVTDGDRVVVLPRATLTLSSDHRVLDGAISAQFLTTLQRTIERPSLLLE
jgi:pyruvate dehydrogenase E2 component (dihydrolipoamide acetyltransferase)